MAGELTFILAGIPILLSMLVPGTLLALPLLKRSKLGLFEKILFGLVIGTVIPPFLMFLVSFAGIGYSFALALAVIALVSLGGLAWSIKENVFSEFGNIRIDLEGHEGQIRFAILLLVSLMILWAFWARMQSLSPVFYEFDPYYYIYSTQYLLQQGNIPLHDTTAWYPEGSTHRLAPITNYLEAFWYSIYTQGGAYDSSLLSVVANVYPPLVGALLAFLAYILMKEEYGTAMGLMAALFCAILPNFIQKFAAGEAEIQPWGLYAIFFFAAAYALVVHRRDRMLAVLAGIAAISIISGSQYFIILSLVYGGYLGLQSLLDFLRGRELREFIELNGIIVVFIIFTALAMLFYAPNYPILERLLVVVGPYLFALALWQIELIVKVSAAVLRYINVNVDVDSAENKWYALLGIIVVGFMLLLVTPLGPKVVGYINSAAGFAGHPEALYMTVAEEAPTEGQLSSAFDVLGMSLFGVSLIQLALFLAAICLAYGVYRDSRLAIFLILLIFPVSYVGMSISKYLLQLGFMLVLAVAIVFGEAMKFIPKLFKSEEEKRNAHRAIMALAFFFSLLVFIAPTLSSSGISLDGAVIELATVNLNQQYWSGGAANCTKMGNDGHYTAYYLYCDKIPDYWLDTMTWIRTQTEPDTRILSWWDYGHWTNFFGERDTLTRNEHANSTKDLMVADKYVFGPRDSPDSGEADLANFMREYKTHYVMMDVDLVSKWGALDFLACVYNNQTNQTYAEKNGMGTSACEREHQFEHVFIPLQPALSDYCQTSDPSVRLLRAQSTFGYTYCVRNDGVMFYEENLTRQNKGVLTSPQQTTYNGKDYALYSVLYFKDPAIWQDNVSGWDDRKGKIYDSNFYKGFVLGELDGFDKAYEWNATNGARYMVIYKLRDYP